MRAGEQELVAQAVEQARARLDLDRVRRAVDGQVQPACGPRALARRFIGFRDGAHGEGRPRRGGDKRPRRADRRARSRRGQRAGRRARRFASARVPTSAWPTAIEPQRNWRYRADAERDAAAGPSRRAATCAAAEANAKSLCRALTSWNRCRCAASPKPESAPPSSRRVAGSVVIIGPTKNSRRRISALAAFPILSVAPRVTATSAISAAGSALASEPPMVPRARVAAWPTKGSLGSSGSSARTAGRARRALPRRGADRDRVALVADVSEGRQCARCRPAASAARAASPSSAPGSARRR